MGGSWNFLEQEKLLAYDMYAYVCQLECLWQLEGGLRARTAAGIQTVFCVDWCVLLQLEGTFRARTAADMNCLC